jgi:hypothetical protein
VNYFTFDFPGGWHFHDVDKPNHDREPTMIIELFVMVFIATYVAIVVLGHALLFGAIVRYWREDNRKTRRQPAKPVGQSMADRTVAPSLSVQNGLRI